MITETYWLAEGQFLAQLEPFSTKGLPSNSIIHKKIPGCGATTLELLSPRNSIIIEPNVPVITSKCVKMNKGKRKYKVIQGVYEEITVSAIESYIQNCKGYKKIMTTPEGFHKVAEAIGQNMYQDYFLLFDECEKAIQDVNFRPGIINPIDAFFEFTGKAFVSATPILPSDPRFEAFKLINIQPSYDFKELINVYTTNNIIYQFKALLDNLNAIPKNLDRKYFIFFKSTKRIINLIRGLKLTDYAVYCSEKSVKDAKRNNVENAYNQINDKLAKYNFLTSRFFSAVDIDYDKYQCNPIIIMLSDIKVVEHSIIDPDTEAIQICGRFRKPEQKEGESAIVIKKDIFHISNYNSGLTSFTKTEIMAILKEKQSLHDYITRFNPSSDIEYINQFIKEILTINGFSSYLLENGSLNYFMVDNFKNQEQVKGYYRGNGLLTEKYNCSEHFSLGDDSCHIRYQLTDGQLLEIYDQAAYATTNRVISEAVKEIMTSDMEQLSKELNISMIRVSHPEQMAIIDQYGIGNAATLDYSIDRIKQEKKNAKGLNELLPIIRYIQRVFEINKGYTSSEIKSLLEAGIAETVLTGFAPDIRLLRNALQLSERQNIRKDKKGKWLKGYLVLGYLQNF